MRCFWPPIQYVGDASALQSPSLSLVPVNVYLPLLHSYCRANKGRGAAVDSAPRLGNRAVCTFRCCHLINLVPLQPF